MNDEISKVVSIRHYKVGYEVRTEEIYYGKNEYTTMRTAYTSSGDCIGDPTWAYRLYKWGIVPEKINANDNICSIGYCEKEQKWYGWNNRGFGICGFGIGDVVKKGDVAAMSRWTEEYLAEHPEEDLSLPIGFTAKTLDDAKRIAIAFAEAVS